MVQPEKEEEKDAQKKPPLDMAKMQELVSKVPGAKIFQEGDKVEGQEEREEAEAEWMRGEFDPCGDGVVSGLRTERGEGRTAELATGPQSGEHDDIVITLRGTPTAEGAESFFSTKAQELDLLHREESTWELQLSDPSLMEHWAAAFRSMSRGDWCRFTCAAKKGHQWLQNLVDCVTPDSSLPEEEQRRRQKQLLKIPPIARKVCVEVRLDRWSEVKDVSRKKDKSLFKRLLELPNQVVPADPKAQLEESLRHVGEMKPEDSSAIGEEEGGPLKRRPRAPDRVGVRYELKRFDAASGWVVVKSEGLTQGKKVGRVSSFTIGGGMGGAKQWAIVEQCVMRLEEGERALFSFAGSDSWLPMRDVFGFKEGDAFTGARMELDVKLESLLKCSDCSPKRDNSISKSKIEVGSGFWRPRAAYQVTVTAATPPADTATLKGAPKGSSESTFGLYDGEEPFGALHHCVATMALHESCLVTANAEQFQPWPLAAALPKAAEDGTVTMWLRLDSFQRIELFANDEVRKEVQNKDDVQWLESAFTQFKGELPMLEEDVGLKFAMQAADAAGKVLFPEALVEFRTGDMPLCEDWMLQIFHTVRPKENFTLTCKGGHARSLVVALAKLFEAQKQRPVDGAALGAHVEVEGLRLSCQVVDIVSQPSREGHTSAELLGIVSDVKSRANALFEAGYVAGAMRKYVRAAFLARDGEDKEDP